MGEGTPTVEIILDKPRQMRLTFGVVRQFKKITGKDFTQITKENMDFDDLSALFYLTLQVGDKELTQEQSDDLLDFNRLGELVDKLGTLLNTSLPEDDGGPKAESPTG